MECLFMKGFSGISSNVLFIYLFIHFIFQNIQISNIP